MKISIKSKPNFTKKGGEKRMKYSKAIIAFVVAGLALGTYITSQAAEDVRSSKHNLVANTNIGATGTTEVCVFCHTPHGGRTDVAGGAAPIWNRSLSTATYTVYTSPNFDAAGTTPGTPKGVSVACLSCHDGTVAFDALINKRGSGGYVGANITNGNLRAGLTFTGGFVDFDGSFKIHGLIEFDLAVTNIKEGKAGLRVYVVGTEGRSKSEKISHLKFKVKPYIDVERKSEANQVAIKGEIRK